MALAETYITDVTLSKGDVVCSAEATGRVTLATPRALASAGSVLGIAVDNFTVEPLSPVAATTVTIAEGGVLAADITGLARGNPSPVVVSPSHRAVRKDAFTIDDQFLGFADPAGNLTVVVNGLPFHRYRDLQVLRGVITTREGSLYMSADHSDAINAALRNQAFGGKLKLPAGRFRFTKKIYIQADSWYPAVKKGLDRGILNGNVLEGSAGAASSATAGTCLLWDGPDLFPGVGDIIRYPGNSSKTMLAAVGTVIGSDGLRYASGHYAFKIVVTTAGALGTMAVTFDTAGGVSTTLTADAIVGGSSLVVASAAGFVVGSRLQLGGQAVTISGISVDLKRLTITPALTSTIAAGTVLTTYGTSVTSIPPTSTSPWVKTIGGVDISFPPETYAVGDAWIFETAKPPTVSSVVPAASNIGGSAASPLPTISGTPNDVFKCQIKCVRGGVNNGSPTGATFIFSKDGYGSLTNTLYASYNEHPKTTKVTCTNNTAPTVQLNGTPADNYDVRIKITVGGGLGVASYQWSTDGGVTYNGADTVTPRPTVRMLGGVTTNQGSEADLVLTATMPGGIQIAATGMVPWFANGTYVTNDIYTIRCTNAAPMGASYVPPLCGGMTINFPSGTYHAGDVWTFTADAKRNVPFQCLGQNITLKNLSVMLQPGRAPRSVVEFSKSPLPGALACTGCVLSNFYVFGSAGNGSSARNMIVNGRNFGPELGVPSAADPGNCDEHTFMNVTSQNGAYEEAAFFCPNTSGQMKNVNLIHFAGSGGKWLIRTRTGSYYGHGLGSGHHTRFALRQEQSSDPIIVNGLDLEACGGALDVAFSSVASQVITINGGRLDFDTGTARGIDGLHPDGVWARTNCGGPVTFNGCAIVAGEGCLPCITSDLVNGDGATIIVNGCNWASSFPERWLGPIPGSANATSGIGRRGWRQFTGNQVYTEQDPKIGKGGSGCDFIADNLVGPFFFGAAVPNIVDARNTNTAFRGSATAIPICSGEYLVTFGPTDTLKQAVHPDLEFNASMTWIASIGNVRGPNAPTDLTVRTERPSKRGALVRLSAAPGTSTHVDVLMTPKRTVPAGTDLVDFATLPNLVALIDAGWDMVVDNDAGVVSKVFDKSGNGFHFTCSGATRPIFHGDGLGNPNGWPYFDLIGLGGSITLPTTALTASAEINDTILAVESSTGFLVGQPLQLGAQFVRILTIPDVAHIKIDKVLTAPIEKGVKIGNFLGNGYTVIAVFRNGNVDQTGVSKGTSSAGIWNFNGATFTHNNGTRWLTHSGTPPVMTDGNETGRWNINEVTWTPGNVPTMKVNGTSVNLGSAATNPPNPITASLSFGLANAWQLAALAFYSADHHAASALTTLRNNLISKYAIQ
jgi:hypothetical protein